MAKVIGIDLGTTNSCVAVMEGGEPKVIPNAEGIELLLRSWLSPKQGKDWSGRSPKGRRLPIRKIPFSPSKDLWAESTMRSWQRRN